MWNLTKTIVLDSYMCPWLLCMQVLDVLLEQRAQSRDGSDQQVNTASIPR